MRVSAAANKTSSAADAQRIAGWMTRFEVASAACCQPRRSKKLAAKRKGPPFRMAPSKLDVCTPEARSAAFASQMPTLQST